MPRLSQERFGAAVLGWAKSSFEEEIRTGFRRAETFDDPLSRLLIRVLRHRPIQELRLLAQVLPLGVFWETPEAQLERERLPPDARQAVGHLRRDFDREYVSDKDMVERIRKQNDPAIRTEFRYACNEAKSVIRSIAQRWEWHVDTGGPGEWGLIRDIVSGRLVISLNLHRNMTISYKLSLLDSELMRVRFNDDYLTVLGIGAGAWDATAAVGTCSEKLLIASEFAGWHAREYEKLIR